MIEEKNALIEGTFLGKEDHGIMTAYLYLHYGGSGQGFGGYALDEWNEKEQTRIGSVYGMEFIMNVLRVVDVAKWEDLKGKHIRVKAEHSKIHAIGHIVADAWFYPADIQEEKKHD